MITLGNEKFNFTDDTVYLKNSIPSLFQIELIWF